MKRYLMLCLCVALSVLSFAQEDADTRSEFYPSVGDFGVTGNISGLISNISVTSNTDLINTNSLVLRYTKGKNLTYRVGLAPRINNFSVNRTDSVGKNLVEFDSNASATNISIRPGIEYHFKGTNRLDPYTVFDVELGVVGSQKMNSVTNVTDTAGTAKTKRTITEDGGFSLGAKVGLGMNFYVSPKLFLGVEYGVGVMNVVSGGDRQEVVQVEPVSGSNTTTRNLSSTRTSQVGLYVDPMIQLTVGYFFGLKHE